MKWSRYRRYFVGCNELLCCSSVPQINFSFFNLIESTNIQVAFWFAVRPRRLRAVSRCLVCAYEIEKIKTKKFLLFIGINVIIAIDVAVVVAI